VVYDTGGKLAVLLLAGEHAEDPSEPCSSSPVSTQRTLRAVLLLAGEHAEDLSDCPLP
jgi:hypothetical protein